MQTFVSSISKKVFPLKEKVSGNQVRDCLLEEIQKDAPDFNNDSLLALSELNEYRGRYMRSLLKKEGNVLSELENKVIAALHNHEIISHDIAEDKREDKEPFGEKLADRVAEFVGSWKFIIIFSLMLFVWMVINVILATKAFDPYPFILLNLILSCVAAMQAPLIMMSQNRQEIKDRDRAKSDYIINLKSELEVRLLNEKIDHLINNQQTRMMEIQEVQMDIMNDILERLQGKGKEGKSETADSKNSE